MDSNILCNIIEYCDDVFPKNSYAIIFSGSFSRGEETILISDKINFFPGDIEFTIFQSNFKWALKKGHREFSSLIKKLSTLHRIKSIMT